MAWSYDHGIYTRLEGEIMDIIIVYTMAVLSSFIAGYKLGKDSNK